MTNEVNFDGLTKEEAEMIEGGYDIKLSAIHFAMYGLPADDVIERAVNAWRAYAESYPVRGECEEHEQ